MERRKEKRYRAFLGLNNYFIANNAALISALPPIAPAIAEFTTLYAALFNEAIITTYLEPGDDSTDVKNSLKLECKDIVWKLTEAMQFHFAMLGNEIALDKVKMTQSKLKIMAEKDFYAYGQLLMNLYVPGVYVPYGIPDADIDVLKLKLLDFPNKMQLTHDSRMEQKLAIIKFDKGLHSMSLFLKGQMDKLINMLKTSHSGLYHDYYHARKLGFPGRTKGNPHKHGTLGPGEMVVLDKHHFRRKKAIIVINTGASALEAGIGHTDTAMDGTPFTIAPGLTRQRISQKLVPKDNKGEFILLKNIGEEETGYEVWMKE